MLFSVAICDRYSGEAKKINRYIKSSGNNYRIFVSNDPEELIIWADTEKPDIVLLDIELELETDFQPGLKIKKRNPNSLLIFLSKFEIYVLQVFCERTFYYLIRPLKEEDVQNIVCEAKNYIRREKQVKLKNSYYFLEEEDCYTRVPYSRILYFHRSEEKIIIMRDDGIKLSYNGNFEKLEQEIEKDIFISCGNNYIVNTGKIKECKGKKLILENNFEVPFTKSLVTISGK